jgi:hypothetical protein
MHYLIECGLSEGEGGDPRGCRLARLLLGGDKRRRSSSSPRDPWSQSWAVVGGAEPGLDVRETHKLQKRCAWCGCRRGAFGVCIPFLSLIGVTVQVLGASRDKLHPELTKHAYCVHLCYQPCPFQQCRHKCMPRHTPREGVRPTIGDQTIAI